MKSKEKIKYRFLMTKELINGREVHRVKSLLYKPDEKGNCIIDVSSDRTRPAGYLRTQTIGELEEIQINPSACGKNKIAYLTEIKEYFGDIYDGKDDLFQEAGREAAITGVYNENPIQIS